MASTAVAFRFDAAEHEYIDTLTGQVLPHITGLLQQSGLIDDTWYTEESCERGQMVHRLTADYDLGALNPTTCVSRYRGYLMAYVGAKGLLRPEILAVEEPMVHPVFRFGGRPDRIVRIDGARGVLEIKSGAKERVHGVQTALQAILDAEDAHLPERALVRYGVYVKPTGRFQVEEFTDKRDFDQAHDLIRRFCR